MKAGPHLLLTLHIRAKGLPAPIHEYRFNPKRRWRLDIAWPDLKIGVECHGGVWSGGRHTRGGGFEKDREKMNAAQELGWSVYEYTTTMIESGEAVKQLARILR